jgi:hypothetical protein
MAEGSIAGWLVALAIGALAGFALGGFRRLMSIDEPGSPATPPAPTDAATPTDLKSESDSASQTPDAAAPPHDVADAVRAKSNDAPAAPETDASMVPPASPTASVAALDEIDRELRAAHDLIDQGDDEVRSIAADLIVLDAAIRKLNARLRAILREVRRSPDSGPEDPN